MDFSLQDLEDNIQVNAISPLIIGRSLAEQGCEGAIVDFLAYQINENLVYSAQRLWDRHDGGLTKGFTGASLTCPHIPGAPQSAEHSPYRK
jgi:hypothetical protein